MKKKPRRDKFKIYGDLLSALYYSSSAEKIVLTQIQVKINVPYDRLKTYIKETKDLGLIQDEGSLTLTKKGLQYLKMYNRILDFMKRMGIPYR
jgi:predicted transcriptional regulator